MNKFKTENYFSLPKNEQAELLLSVAPIMGRRAEIIEKDIWLCHVLGNLFDLPSNKTMAFKGGTSLSKVYKAIHRFSEDIDVTIDYRDLMPDVPALETLTNNSQRSKLSNALKNKLMAHVKNELLPNLQQKFNKIVPQNNVKFELSHDAEKLWVYYPSVFEASEQYIRQSILIEFGGRNSSQPQETVTICTDISEFVPAVHFPTATISVLSGERTFWEKVTLIHAECYRPNIKLNANRLSRHWYDLAKLADHEIGTAAILNITLLKDVLLIKETFFRSTTTHYQKCLEGELRLIPSNEQITALHHDYREMVKAQMFNEPPIDFEAILSCLTELQILLNQKLKK